MRLHPHTPLRPLLSLSLVVLLAISTHAISAKQPAAPSAPQYEPVSMVWNHTVSGYIPAGMRLPSPVATSVGFVCVYPDLGSVSLVDPSTFSASWTFRVESTPTQIVVGGGSVYVLTEWGRMYGLKLLDGTVVFDSKGIEVEGVDVSIRPAYASGVVALSSGKGLIGLDGSTGKIKWRIKLPWRVTLALSGGGRIVVGHSSGVAAVDPISGAALWNVTFGSPVRSATIVGSSVFAVTDAGTLYELDLATGRTLRSLRLPTPDPAPGEIKAGPDILYVVTKRGRIYPVGIRSFRRLDIIYLEQSPMAQPEMSNYLMLLWTVQGILLGVPAVPSPVDVVFEYPVGAKFISGVGFDSISQVAMFYLSDGRLVALSVPLYSVRVRNYQVREGELTADLLVCAFPGGEGDLRLVAKDELGRELFSDTISVYGGGCFLRTASFEVESSREVKFLLSGMGLQSPPASVELAAEAPPQPPARPGMAIGAPPSLVVGERAEISISVTNGWREGLAYVSVDCEGLDKVRSEEGYIAVGASRTFAVELLPKRSGDLPCKAALVIESEVVHEEEFSLKVERGSVIEGAPEVSPQRITEGGKFTVKLTLVNRYEDGATFTVSVGGQGVVGEATQVGPLAAGEERQVSVAGRVTGTGNKDVTVTVSVGSTLVDSITLPGAITVVAPQAGTTPPPTTTGPGAGLLSRIPEPILDYLPFLLAAVVAGALGVMIFKRRPRPSPKLRRVPPSPRPGVDLRGEVPRRIFEEEIPPRGAPTPAPAPEVREAPEAAPPRAAPEREAMTVRPEREVRAEERPRAPPEGEVRPAAPAVSAEEFASKIGMLKESLQKIVAEAKELEGEGLVGVDERAAVVERKLARAEVLMDIGDLEESQKIVREVEESVRALEETVRQFREILMGGVWPNVEKRISTMLRVWGRAPASMLTMIPSELRMAALARFVKLHPEMRLELRGDELYTLEEGA